MNKKWQIYQVDNEKVEEKILQECSKDYYAGLTLLGGEPFEPANQEAVLHLLKRVRKEFPSKTIWCYTGNVLETDIIDSNGRAHTEYSDELWPIIKSCVPVVVPNIT